MNETGARSASDGLADAMRRIVRLPVARAPGSCFLLLLLTACSSPEPVEVEEKPDRWHPREAQSDFLDIGEQAGVEWLSFVPQDQKKYPEYFESLDRDQKDRLRLAPKNSNERVLLQFDLPDGAKLWPVDWYGTELMAIDLPELNGVSIALAPASALDEDARWPAVDLVSLFHNERFQNIRMRQVVVDTELESERSGGTTGKSFNTEIEGGYGPDVLAVMDPVRSFGPMPIYGVRRLTGQVSDFLLIAEAGPVDDDGNWKLVTEEQANALLDLLRSISIKRELALEGLPKHKVGSSLDELLKGTLHFPEGTLNLPIQNGHLVRKTGGDSTVQIDGQGVEPWILIRRLDETGAEGDLRVRVRNDATFRRRLKVTSADFGPARMPENANLPMLVWDYGDSGNQQELVGIMKVGAEILEFEVVSAGLNDGEKRRIAKEEALKLLTGATSEDETSAPEFEPLVGWNIGTMGRDE